MATRKRRKGKWLRAVFLFILTPLIIWLLAFLLWLFWDDIAHLVTREQKSAVPAPKAAQKSQRLEQPAQSRSGEKIPDEDRKKLEEIIKQRQ